MTNEEAWVRFFCEALNASINRWGSSQEGSAAMSADKALVEYKKRKSNGAFEESEKGYRG